jgi:hypothetical protein
MGASLLFFALHVVGAVLWVLSMAGGFPLFHSLFLANRALPAVVAAVSVAGIYTAISKQPRWNSTLLLGLGTCWATASPATLFITLASTSVGRGFDSVGHTPGTYRNRMRIQTRPGHTTNP